MRLPVIAFLLFVGLLGSYSAQAQHGRQRRHFNSQGRPYYRGPLRLTLAGGTAAYNGDLGGLSENFLGPAVSVGVLYRLRPHLLIGSEFSYFQLGAKDRLTERGLAFHSSNGLGTVLLRFDLLPDESAFSSAGSDPAPFQVYLQAGAGLLLYNPQAYLGTSRPTDNTVYLPSEREEFPTQPGATTVYPAMAGVAPVGAGFSVRLSDALNLGLEGNYYFTTTDHLDDVSLRGNPDQKDGFGTLLVKLDWALQ
jgi:opacity protein-like surface antigen